MFIIHHSHDKGMTGFFAEHPAGGFTIFSDGEAWVTGDILEPPYTRTEDGIAHSAMVQDF